MASMNLVNVPELGCSTGSELDVKVEDADNEGQIDKSEPSSFQAEGQNVDNSDDVATYIHLKTQTPTKSANNERSKKTEITSPGHGDQIESQTKCFVKPTNMTKLACTPKSIKPHIQKRGRLFNMMLAERCGQLVPQGKECIRCWSQSFDINGVPFDDTDDEYDPPERHRYLELPCGHAFCQCCVDTELMHSSHDGNAVWCCNPSDLDLLLGFADGWRAREYLRRTQKHSRSNTTFCQNEPCNALLGCPDTVETICLLCHQCGQQTCTNCKESGHGGDCKKTTVYRSNIVSDEYQCCPDCGHIFYKGPDNHDVNDIICECGFLLCLHCGEAMRYCPCGIENDGFPEYPPERDEHGQMREVPDEKQLARRDKEIEGLKMARRYCQIPEELKQSHLAFAGDACWQYSIESDEWTQVRNPSSSL